MLEGRYPMGHVPTLELAAIQVPSGGPLSPFDINTFPAFGGFGFTSRMWGLTLDTITAINLVLPNGTITRVTNQNYPDLFWVRT